MPRPKSVESEMRAAFERLKNDEPINLVRGAPVTLSNVAKEANMKPAGLRKDRYPILHREIEAYAEIVAASSNKKKNKKARESDSKRIKRLTIENEKLINIVTSLTAIVDQLEYENAQFRRGESNIEKKKY